MEIKAKAKNIKISPRKVRLVIDVVRGMKAVSALNQLKFVNKKAALPVSKVIGSAVSNAVNTFELDKENLFIKEIRVDEGMTMKRWMPRARGSATPLRKRTSHINVVLGELVESGKKVAKKQEIEAPVKLDQVVSEVKEKTGKTEKVKKEKIDKSLKAEKGKKIIDPRGEGHGKHTKIEGRGEKGIVGKMFRRKSG